jgi:hypothetical protein
MIENALGCSLKVGLAEVFLRRCLKQMIQKKTYSLHGHISATIVRIIPTFPFPAPDRALAVKAMGNEVENPHSKLVTMVFNKPVNITYLRPNLSEARPQAIAVTHCDSE